MFYLWNISQFCGILCLSCAHVVLVCKLLRNTGLIGTNEVVLLNWIQVLPSCSTPSSATATATSSLSMRWSGSWNRRSTSWSCVCLTEMSSRAPVCGPSRVNSLRRGGMSTHAYHVQLHSVDLAFYILLSVALYVWTKKWKWKVHRHERHESFSHGRKLNLQQFNFKFRSRKPPERDAFSVSTLLKISLISDSHILQQLQYVTICAGVRGWWWWFLMNTLTAMPVTFRQSLLSASVPVSYSFVVLNSTFWLIPVHACNLPFFSFCCFRGSK